MSLIQIDKQKLIDSGFTESGVKRYENTVSEYSNVLFEKSKKFGEARKSNDSPVEINYENVQTAVKVISASFGDDVIPKWKLWLQAFEYLITAACGYLASQATSKDAPSHYTIFFVIAAVIGVGLFIVRKTSKN
ncbi:MAG: hypothetical protein KAZ91_02780 [Candidatus Fonsibacter sp.]|nr:hypothetical protein [Fluviicola sp.]MBP7837002.1 hypothetical protein [Candidatus Fonsibacter sp.]